jgi:hypothetical protein
MFQGRFKAVLLDRDAYLLEVCRYVELNPAHARMLGRPEGSSAGGYSLRQQIQLGDDTFVSRMQALVKRLPVCRPLLLPAA